MRDSTGRSRCFAFLTFDDPASVNAVMVREHFLDGKIVRYLSVLVHESNEPHRLSIDRSQASYTSARTPTRYKTLHWRSRGKRYIRVYA
jgi:hypothetical protein